MYSNIESTNYYIMRKFSAFLALIIGLGQLVAQTVTYSPSDSLGQSIAMGDGADLQINILNVSQSDVQMEWRILNVTKSENWRILVCSEGICVNDSNRNVQVSRNLVPNDRTLLKATILSDSNTFGSALVVCRIWVLGDSANTWHDLKYHAFNPPLSAQDAQSLASLHAKAYWQGDDFRFVASNGSLPAGTVELYDLAGHRLLKEELPPRSAGLRKSMPGIAPGIYMVRFITAKGIGVQKVVRTSSY